MINDNAELERFKTEINLVEVASYYGYSLVKRESCRQYPVLAHPSGDKIVVSRQGTHDVFFSKRVEAGGSVIDFVMFQERVNMGHARKFLRKFTPDFLAKNARVHFRPEEGSSDSAGIFARWVGLDQYKGGYLERRGLTDSTIATFADRIRIDGHGNVCFRHDDMRSLTGWEVKNRGFTGFSGGGRKSLFAQKIGKVERIVITESAIDSMSYYQLKRLDGLYLSFAGTISKDQMELLRMVIDLYPNINVIVATDADVEGDKYAQLIGGTRDRPAAKDWNDVLMGR